MIATIVLVGASEDEVALVGEITPQAQLIISGESAPDGDSPDLAILFGGRSVGRVNEMLAELAFDDIIPTLLVADPSLADQIDKVELPVTDLIRRPIHKRLLKTRIETQLSLSRALKDVEAITAVGQAAAVTDRRVLDIILEYEVRRKTRYGGALSLVAFSLPEGRKDMTRLSNALRDVDTVAPLREGLAAALLPETDMAGASHVATRLQTSLTNARCAVGTLRENELALDFLERVLIGLEDAVPGEVQVIGVGDGTDVDWSKLD